MILEPCMSSLLVNNSKHLFENFLGPVDTSTWRIWMFSDVPDKYPNSTGRKCVSIPRCSPRWMKNASRQEDSGCFHLPLVTAIVTKYSACELELRTIYVITLAKIFSRCTLSFPVIEDKPHAWYTAGNKGPGKGMMRSARPAVNLMTLCYQCLSLGCPFQASSQSQSTCHKHL